MGRRHLKLNIMNILKELKKVVTPRNSVEEIKAFAEARKEFVKTINESVARRKEFYLTKAKLEGVGIVHIFDKESPKGGLTIAYKKCNPYKSGIMVDIAVNTCAAEDTFSRSHGTTGALEKFFDGKVVSLPLLKFYSEDELSSVIKEQFKRMFLWF